MSVFITGDTHGSLDIAKLKRIQDYNEYKDLTKDDYLIILGDFGLIWNAQSNLEEINNSNFYSSKPYTTLFVDGNHENFDRINSLPEIDMFGGKVGKYSDSIYHLKRGEVYTIQNKKYFVFGGADSIDKENRQEYLSWWSQEQPSTKECNHGLENLDIHDWEVDYVLTHTIPLSDVDFIMQKNKWNYYGIDPVTKYLETIKLALKYKEWFAGHWHDDITINKLRIFYDDIKKI